MIRRSIFLSPIEQDPDGAPPRGTPLNKRKEYAMQKVIMYSTDICPFCVQAKRLLAEKGVEVMEIKVDAEPGKLKEMMGVTGRRSVPQIFIGGTHVGGYDDLSAWHGPGSSTPC